ncbi:unnamed protein product [Rodentolepis nana]|uniref:AGC-kinase C-terminal domain-containing protein n=1 Tax=Rodentolepis nana TaxID=102285 RepID=A0A0R3TSU2_RODNA|nr:unnamed protein product [Rodentolepis nana]
MMSAQCNKVSKVKLWHKVEKCDMPLTQKRVSDIDDNYTTNQMDPMFLLKSPSRRLGCVETEGGEAAIQRHPFFREIDWKLLEERKIRPPFRPKVRSRFDTTNFDKDFTNEDPVLTPLDHSSELAALEQDVFAAFDCVNPDYSALRHHAIRPSQQQPLLSVSEGVNITSTDRITTPVSPEKRSQANPNIASSSTTISDTTATSNNE